VSVPEFELILVGLAIVCGVAAAALGLVGFVFKRDQIAPRASAAAAVEAPTAAPVEAPAREEPPAAAPADMRSGLAKTRSAILGRLEELLRGKSELDASTVDELERLLFGADLGVRTAGALLETARAAGSADRVREALRGAALDMLRQVAAAEPTRGRPHVILVVGVNGSGKTTSIGKLAMRFKREGKSVVLGAGDTFRAAAIEQLSVWAERAGVEIVKGVAGGDPAAVAYDAVQAASARDLDVVILDTAGRLQTDAGLMDELQKIARVVKKEVPDAPHEVILVLDANTGQNAIRQAQEFQRAVNVDGILLAKLDGTAKGGVVLGIAQEVGIPVRYIGLGEAVDDLVDFDDEQFVDALFAPSR
jgi:fused signal recognition particle receptor